KAIEAARTARANAGSPEEVDRIEATMRAIENGSSLVHSISPMGPSFGPKQHGSKRDEARASSSLPRSSGVLVQIDCLGKLYRMHLISGNQKLLLLVRDPGNVIIRNRGPLEFSCGPTEERNATVEYRPHVNTIYLTQGDVVSIELQ
ncbi:MAG TPA: hypothetical protein VEQ63_00420, partial [Bryobacteraceae bacterium]|nr:hypothetical protein [Bryobacteraceae bacterium]